MNSQRLVPPKSNSAIDGTQGSMPLAARPSRSAPAAAGAADLPADTSEAWPAGRRRHAAGSGRGATAAAADATAADGHGRVRRSPRFAADFARGRFVARGGKRADRGCIA
eukprot:1488819-Prymnesium_polylepis.1